MIPAVECPPAFPATEADLGLEGFVGRPVGTIPELIRARARLTPGGPAFHGRDGAGAWQVLTWSEVREAMDRVARVLVALGIRAGDRVGIQAPGSAAWDVIHLGILAAGGIVVGLDPSEPGGRVLAAAERWGLAGLVLGDPARLGDLESGGRFAFILDLPPGSRPWAEPLRVLAAGARAGGPEGGPGPEPGDTATLVFTSGTTGASRAIPYTHRQMLQAAASILRTYPEIREGARLVSWLPLSGLFQRMVNLCAAARGAQVFYVEDPHALLEALPAVGPDLLVGVPRFFEKFQQGVMARIEGGPPWKRDLGRWALAVGRRAADAGRPALSPWERGRHWLADRLVLGAIRAPLGPRLRFLVSGSAPMPRWLLAWYESVGLPVLEAYGLSEQVIPVAANRMGARRLGTVGRPLPGVEVRLAEDGELWVRSPGTCTGYLDGSGVRMDDQGYLATGDQATLDPDGFITLLGRKGDIFKTSTGRRIAPAGLEGALLAVPGVEQALLVGAGRPYPVAILVVPPGAVPGRDLVERLRGEVRRVMAAFAPWERPGGLVVTSRPFTVQNGQLTASLKPRRHIIEAAHLQALEALYDGAAGADGEALWCDL